MKMISDLVTILNTGACIDIEVGTKMTSDLVTLAAAAKRAGGHLTIRGLTGKMTSDLAAIGRAGQSHVTLVLK